MIKRELPKDVHYILKKLHHHGHEAFIVGGCVRDLMLGKVPKDWDLTTSAEPSQVKALFSRTVDTGLEHGTVTILKNKIGYEITTYRVDGKYENHRRPKAVAFTKCLKEDLKRRDFTINAMAYNEESGFIDLFGGEEDLKRGIIRCVGDPDERFHEDALRMLRAIRFAARFGFEIESETGRAITLLSKLIEKISAERIKMELTQILCSKNPDYISKLVHYGLMPYVIPEFMSCVNLSQNHPYHIYEVDEHTYRALKEVKRTEALRWAIFLHDIGKGYSKTTDDEGVDHFYGHSKISVELSKTILSRLKFDNKTKNHILKLIAYHDYRFEPNAKSLRKAVAHMGVDMFIDYMAVQEADVRAQAPSKLQERLDDLEVKKQYFEALMASKHCLTIQDLNIRGKDLMDLGVEKGERIGILLKALLELVIEEPELNKKKLLLEKAEILIHKG
jgi:tRNA nucleotidyltransferase (CCA-adding enzyme)